jgi:hypothetical protein
MRIVDRQVDISIKVNKFFVTEAIQKSMYLI